MQGAHLRNIDDRAAADRNQALDTSRNCLFNFINHLGGRLALAIRLDEKGAAVGVERLEILVVQEFIC